MSESLPDEGARYLNGLERSHRRAHGKVYTSNPLAEFVLDQAVGPLRAPAGPVLDPACGAGVFLVATVHRIANEFSQLGLDITSRGRRSFLREVGERVWGLDLDPTAVDLARKELQATVERLSPGPLQADFFSKNVVVGDFLGAHVEDLLPVNPRLIVGNPPYVTTDRLSAAAKADLKARFSTAFGRLDLYTLFMEQAVRLLGDHGTLAFITPDKYLTSNSARSIRQLLAESGNVRSIAQFETHRVFDDAATVPCVTIWQANAPSGTVVVSRVELPGPQGTPTISESREVPSTELSKSDWSFQRAAHESLIRRLSQGHARLHERTSRISAGLTTGYNPAFVLSAEQAMEIESELLHRTIRGRDIRPHQIQERDEFMLVPYSWAPDGSRRLIDLKDFPKAGAWLRTHRERLEARHCVRVWGKAWWDLHDPVNGPLHLLPKVVVPDVARSNRFATDEGRYVPQHSVYYMVPQGIHAEVLAAILNSPPVEFLVRAQAPLVKDGFSRYRRQFLKTLPVPDIDETAQWQIQEAVAEGRHDDLNELTTALFGIDMEEIRRALETLDSR